MTRSWVRHGMVSIVSRSNLAAGTSGRPWRYSRHNILDFLGSTPREASNVLLEGVTSSTACLICRDGQAYAKGSWAAQIRELR